MPYLCNCSACPEKITELLEYKGVPKKSSPAAIKDVDAQLQELLVGIESESGSFPSTVDGLQTADIHTVAPLPVFSIPAYTTSF
jgi:flap endonuclease GEN